MPTTEVKLSPWGVGGLWSQKEAIKCNAAIVDTILVGGDPRWMYTTKNGEVGALRSVFLKVACMVFLFMIKLLLIPLFQIHELKLLFRLAKRGHVHLKLSKIDF
jgi:hypothetical protein